jgi:hypothetical protein
MGMITGTEISRRQVQPVSGDQRQLNQRESAIQCLAVVRGKTLSNSDTKSTELKPRSISDLPSREPLSKAGKICDEGHSFVTMRLNMDSSNAHRTGAPKTE